MFWTRGGRQGREDDILVVRPHLGPVLPLALLSIERQPSRAFLITLADGLSSHDELQINKSCAKCRYLGQRISASVFEEYFQAGAAGACHSLGASSLSLSPPLYKSCFWLASVVRKIRFRLLPPVRRKWNEVFAWNSLLSSPHSACYHLWLWGGREGLCCLQNKICLEKNLHAVFREW